MVLSETKNNLEEPTKQNEIKNDTIILNEQIMTLQL